MTAAKLVVKPIFAADFADNAYSDHPARGAGVAVREVYRLIYRDLVDADFCRYFDWIPRALS